eukprot:7667721-Ditylum_brightwellii.AAC.1
MMVSEVELTLARLFSDKKVGMLNNGAVASSDVEAKKMQGMMNKDTPMKTNDPTYNLFPRILLL